MSKLKILFAITQKQSREVEEKILEKYKDQYKKEFIYEKAFYNEDIVKSLSENHYDILILMDRLEKNPTDPKFIDKLTDKFSDTRIILIMEENRKDSDFVKKIYAMGCYDFLFSTDFNFATIIPLLEKGRTKKAAKSYYEIDDKELENIEETITTDNIDEISEEELLTVINNFNNSSSENIKELFELAEKTYTKEQMTYLISILNTDEDNKTIKLLKENDCNISKYERLLAKDINKTEIKGKVKKVEKIVEKIVEKPVEKIVEKEIVKKEYVDREIEVVKEVYKTPNDYKKVIGIAGADRRVGSTTLIQMIAEVFTNENKKVGIIDFKLNRDLFEKYIFNEETKNEPLIDFKNGIDNPFMINKYCSLYTSSSRVNDLSLDSNEMNSLIDYVKSRNDIVLIDFEFNEVDKIYSLLDKILIVVNQDLTSTKYFTDILSNQMDNIFLSNMDTKVQFIVNKYIKDSKALKSKDLVECYLHKVVDYLDTSQNKKIIDNKNSIFKLSFNEDILINSYRGINRNLAQDESIEDELNIICNSIYPISEKKVKGKRLIGNLFKRK